MIWTYTDLMEWDDSNGNVPNVSELDISYHSSIKLPQKMKIIRKN